MRLFQDEFGGQVSWLIPAALLSLVALLWVSRRTARTNRTRAFALLWGGWLLVTGLVFSYMQGIIHPYYMVAPAPAIGALVGVGAMALWQAGLPLAGRVAAAVGVAGSGAWTYVLLDRTPDWLPWLRWTVLAAGLLGAVALFAVPARQSADGRRRAPFLVWAPLALALVAGLGGPLPYSIDTAATTHTGSIPSAGPTVTGSFGGPGGAADRGAASAAAPAPAEPAPGQEPRPAAPARPLTGRPAPARLPEPAAQPAGRGPGRRAATARAASAAQAGCPATPRSAVP